MCGIFGIYRKEGVEEGLLGKAAEVISYRGPDAEGFFVSEDRTVGLAHKRLSIIDLSEAGRQPMCDPEGRLWIVFNGEIYNFPELKETLMAEGFSFRSSSDTEVLLYAYKKWGAGCLERINGMFAFAVYDLRERKLFLARDRMGKKPLFYSSFGGAFIFASELKSILSTGLVPADIDHSALNHYFALGYVPSPMSIVRGARKLPPGHFLNYDIESGRPEIRQYWDAPDFEGARDEPRILEEVEALLADSVKRRLISDVPLGAFLSGGVDSSLVVAMMRKAHSGEIKTFSIGFEGSKRSELPYSSMVARHLGTTHKEIIIAPKLEEDLEHVSGLMDEPIYDNSLLPTYYLSRHTRQYVTVALSGDGGDELFGGYIHYKSALAARRISRFAPPPFNRLAGAVASIMPEGRFGKNTLYGIARGSKSCFTYPTLIFKEEERGRLLSPPVLEGVDLKGPVLMREALMDKNYDFVNQMCYADMKTNMADDILQKVDRASMFVSLEVRCPILDYRMAEYSFGYIPGGLKIKGGVKKYILKRLAGKYLPPELNLERKQGFDIPGDLLSRTYLSGRLLDFPQNDFLSSSFVSGLVGEQKTRNVYLWHKLFAVYFFLRWLETWKR